MLNFQYPKTKRVDTFDIYHGIKVHDPYRWLEDDLSQETKSWVNKQNEYSSSYFESIPFRDLIREELTKIWNYERLGIPTKEGAYTYFSKNDGLQNQNVIYRSINDKEPELFLDPNSFSKDGTISLGGLFFSKRSKFFAYTISEGGSDWRKVIVKSTETNQVVEDTLTDIKFSSIAWQGDEGFFYSSYDKPEEGSELSGKTEQHKLYYHKLGTPQNQDRIIFGNTPKQKHRYVNAIVSEDNRYLIISASVSTTGNKLFIKDLNDSSGNLITILDQTDTDTYFIDNVGSKLFLITNKDAPNKKVVTVDAVNPIPENWEDVIPESKDVLNVNTAGGYFFAEYMADAISKVIQYDYNGKHIRDVTLPGIGSIGGFEGKSFEKVVYYTFTNYKTPQTIYKYSIKEGISEIYHKPNINFNPENYESKQVFYNSKDGTKVPMIITYKKGLKLNGKTPTILYGYGGFNVSLTPGFSIANSVWLKNGGVYAVANLRGGGEYGESWHLAGVKMNKQNVFDDFIAAAEYLIENKYTSSDYLAIRGGSNGGLLIGATMTQRPGLAKVALPAVGVLDMLRYHTFTSGAGWAYDYGTSKENKEMFEYLKGYSPVHNVIDDSSYPATLVTTGDHDDRVVPAHSFKFISELQYNSKNTKNPLLIRIETDAGHGAGTPTKKLIDLYTDIFSFTLFSMKEDFTLQEK